MYITGVTKWDSPHQYDYGLYNNKQSTQSDFFPWLKVRDFSNFFTITTNRDAES